MLGEISGIGGPLIELLEELADSIGQTTRIGTEDPFHRLQCFQRRFLGALLGDRLIQRILRRGTDGSIDAECVHARAHGDTIDRCRGAFSQVETLPVVARSGGIRLIVCSHAQPDLGGTQGGQAGIEREHGLTS